jgi:flagellar motor switch/type III secretory pathway protein FliN
VQAALEDVVAEWSRRWFSQGVAGPVARRDRERQLAASAEQLQVAGEQVSVRLSGRGRRQLLEAALCENLGSRALNPADHQLLETFSRRVAEDLVERIDSALSNSRSDKEPRETSVELGISLNGREICSIHCVEEALLPLIRLQLGEPAGQALPLQQRMAALGPVRFEVESVLGRVELAADDLEGLAIGDVLILDRSVHAPVELCISGVGHILGRGRLGRDGDRCTITF